MTPSKLKRQIATLTQQLNITEAERKSKSVKYVMRIYDKHHVHGEVLVKERILRGKDKSRNIEIGKRIMTKIPKGTYTKASITMYASDGTAIGIIRTTSLV